MRPRVKICGITRDADARLAVRLGAHAIGFVFWARSPRYVAPEAARAIAAAMPALVTRVGVFVNEAPATVAEVVRLVGLDVVQLHGDESIESYRSVGGRLIRAVTADDDGGLATATALPADVMPLVDAADPVRRGGTGRVTDWSRAARLAAKRPIMLAGGLHAGNVADAVAAVRPWALDVSSGVEAAPGIKAPERLDAFFAAWRQIREQGAEER